jgi:hypothetical protein
MEAKFFLAHSIIVHLNFDQNLLINKSPRKIFIIS